MTYKGPTNTSTSTAMASVPVVSDRNHQRDIKKRKRPLSMDTCKKTVRFSIEDPQIIWTWSSVDYDRGGLFSAPVLYKLNPAIANLSPSSPPPPAPLPPQSSVTKPKLSVDIQACAHISRRYSEDDDSAGLSGGSTCSSVSAPSPDTPADHGPAFLLPISTEGFKTNSTPAKPNRPRLTIDTSICSGPSLFTTLSTHTIPRLMSMASQDEDNTTSDYLVPMSAVPV